MMEERPPWPTQEETIMTKAALEAKSDALGLVALGSIIVNLAQGKAHGDLAEKHQQLLAHYQDLLERYKQMWREYEGLRSMNQELQRQGREYQTLVDALRGQVSTLQKRIVEKEAHK